jgi:hypothetical protein
MNPKSKSATLALVILLAVSSLALFGFASAQSKPSVPEFTVRFVDNSYNVTTTNFYTGVTETNLQINYSIEVTIKNQVFDNSGHKIFFNIQMKAHFTDDWKEVYPLENQPSSKNGDGTFSYAEYICRDAPSQSSSSYTTITFPVVITDLYSASGYDIQRYYSGSEDQEGRLFAILNAIPSGGQIDFQVETLTGHNFQTWVIQHPLTPTYGGYFEPAVAYDSSSGWSPAQTVIISGSLSASTPITEPAEPRSIAPDSTQMPTSTPQQPQTQTETSFGVDWKLVAVGLVVTVAVMLVVVGLLWRKITKK